MDYTIEREFFKAFEPNGVVSNCIDYILFKNGFAEYSLWSNESLVADLSNRILQARENFDETIIVDNNSLMDEIEVNINECSDSLQLDKYIYTILIPFKELSNVYYPEALINHKEIDIKWQSTQIEEMQDLENPKSKFDVELHNRTIVNHREEIEKYVARKTLFSNLTNEIWADSESKIDMAIKECFAYFQKIASTYADKLYVLLLWRKIDLKLYQNEYDIYLKTGWSIYDIYKYTGTIDIAKKLIADLPKSTPSVETQPNKFNTPTFPKKGDIEWFVKLREFLISNNFIDTNIQDNDFLFWFGFGNDVSNPTKIVWIENKQLARELLEGLYKDLITVAKIERLSQTCFDYKKIGSPLKLAKNKTNLDMRSDKITNFLATHLTN